MRIAISGSHSLGKSTVVKDWLETHPEFRHEDEPYRVLGLHGPYEIKFRESSTRLHNGIQMYYNISRLYHYRSAGDDVIFDRAPVDYLAYSQYTANQGTTDINSAFVASMVPAVRESLGHLDILAFVPKSEAWPVEMEADGIRPVDHAYRDEVDAIFKQIYREGRFAVMPAVNPPLMLELVGSRSQRLDQLRVAIADVRASLPPLG
jgi:hypothetical protein